MKQLTILALLLASLTSAPIHAAEEPVERQMLVDMAISLTNLMRKGETCGLRMNYYGKNGLSNPECVDFDRAFYSRWENRDALNTDIEYYWKRYYTGGYDCSDCVQLLNQVADLRVLVVYYLDYMDFLRYEI